MAPGMTDANRDSPLTTGQVSDSLGSSGCNDMELGFSCPDIPLESFVVSTWCHFKWCRLSCLAYQGMRVLELLWHMWWDHRASQMAWGDSCTWLELVAWTPRQRNLSWTWTWTPAQMFKSQRSLQTATSASEFSVQFNRYQQGVKSAQKTLSQVLFICLLPKLKSTKSDW